MLSWEEKIVSISDDESGLSRRRIAAVTLSLKQAQLTASVRALSVVLTSSTASMTQFRLTRPTCSTTRLFI